MSTIPPPLLLLLNSMRTSWNILVPPYLPATFGSDRMNDQEKSSSLSPQPPPSPVVAVVSDCKIEFLSTSGGNSAVGGHTSSVSLTRDVNSYLRVSTWFQSNLVAVCDSDGALHVVSYADGNGILLAQIMPQMPPPLAGHPKTAKSSPRVPSSIDPASVIFLIDPHLSRRGLLEAPLKNFTHELIVVCYNSTVRSYLLDVNTLMKMVKSTGGGSPVIVYRDEDPTGWPNCILPFHSLSFSKFSPTMSCAIIENQSLILAGCLSPTLDFNAEDIECESLFVFELCARFPYYITTSASRTSSSSIKQKPQIQQPVPLVESSKGMQFFKSVVGNITRSIMGSPFIYVLSMQFSRENNHFVLLDSSGRLMIVKSNSREIAHTWSITDLLINLRLDNTANESLMPNRVSWWSAFEIVISFTNGHLYILVMPEFINLLGDLPERFSAPITFNCTTGQECLYVLEEKRDECLARKQANGSYFIIRTGSDTELIGGGGSGGSSAALSPSTTSLNSASSSSTLITASTPLTWYQQIERIAAVASPLRFLVNAFLWHWDSDDVGATKVIKLSKRTMGLLLLAKSSPEEALTTRIANRDYQGALELAIGFSLETDLVYKAMWLDSSDVLDVHAFEKITDKSWVLDSCLRRVGLKSKSTKHLLQYGLNLTNATRLSDVVAELEAILSEIDIAATGSNEGVEHIPKIFYSNISLHSLCKYRIQFFKYLDRLESHTAIYGPLEEYPDLENPSALISFPVHFAKFRDMDMVDLAKFYALHGNIQSLKILFTRHGKELLPYRFILLDHMPETLKPSVYRLFLPIIDNGKEEMQFDIIPWRQRDWCEDKQVMEYCGWIENLDSELEDTVGGSSATSSDQVNRSDLAVESAVGSTAISPTLPAPFPATPDVVQCWYECRARFIESCTGQTDLAIELIKYGIQFNVSGLEKLDCNLGIINDLIYTCLEPESVVCAELDIQRIETMEPEDIVHLFLQDDDLNDDQIFGLMNGHILPYLKKLAVVDPLHATLSSTVICNYLQRVSTGRLGLSLTVFERFKESGDVFETHGHLIDTFVSCVYGFLNTAEYGSLIKRLRQLTTILQSSCAKQNGKSGFSQLGSSSKVATSSKLPSADGWETDLDLDTDTPSTHVAVINNQVEVERLATLAAHFNAFELLYRLGLVYSFLWLREVAADEKKQQKMVIDLVETLTGHKDHHYIVQDNVKPWNDVLYAIIELKNLSMLELVGLGWCISLLFEKSLMFGGKNITP